MTAQQRDPGSPTKPALLLFGGVALVDLALAPFSLDGRGYNLEEIDAARRLLDDVAARFSGRPVDLPFPWPRHGVVELAFQLPFLLAGRLLSGGSPRVEMAAVSLLPILSSALLVTLVYLWGRQESGHRPAFVAALALAFGTMLFPYTYIGLETTQSAALLLAGWLALARPGPVGRGRFVALVLSGAVALSAKGGGLFLAPAVGFLFWRALRRADGERSTSDRGRLAVALVVAAAFLLVASAARAPWFAPYGGQWGFYSGWFVRDPLSPLFHAAALLASPNKGLLFFAPIAFLALFALPEALRRRRDTPLFALLTLGGLLAGFAILRSWSDETWGPRYLHTAVAPLAVVLATWLGERPLPLARRVAFLAAAVLGVAVSLPGALFYYGRLHRAAYEAGRGSLQDFQGDPAWNHVLFDYRLGRLWLRRLSGKPDDGPWTPAPDWWLPSPPDAPVPKSVALGRWAEPQALMLRSASPLGAGAQRSARIALLGFLLAGIAMLAAAGRAAGHNPPD